MLLKLNKDRNVFSKFYFSRSVPADEPSFFALIVFEFFIDPDLLIAILVFIRWVFFCWILFLLNEAFEATLKSSSLV